MTNSVATLTRPSNSAEASLSNDLALFKLDEDHFFELLDLQDRVFDTLQGRPWLRRSSAEDLMEHIEQQGVLGAQIEGELVAAAILYDGQTTNESIRGFLTDNTAHMLSSINLKAIFTSPEHRQFGLGRRLVSSLDDYVISLGKTEIACTIHRDNHPSKKLFTRLGYEHQGETVTSYGHREIYTLSLVP